MKKVLFIDRDGTLIKEPGDKQIDSLEKLEFYPGAIRYLSMIQEYLDYELVMVTNQDGLGTSSFPESDFWPAQNSMLKTLEGEGVIFEEVLIDKSFDHQNLATRKPGLGMLQDYFSKDYDLENSFVIGDRITDMELAQNLGCKGILIQDNLRVGFNTQVQVLQTESWKEIYSFLRFGLRVCELNRKTNEAEVSVSINLDGAGKSTISTGLGFFDHMLQQISRHALIDLDIETKGDLYVDEHHTVEDTAIVLGEAFRKALRQKEGLSRYGFCLPMDDCLAQVALDLGGRNDIVWKANFKREKIGDMPTEMFHHFFKSFSNSALCNLNIKAEGSNEHHKIESIFKAFARAIKMAISRDLESSVLPTTKGLLV